MIDDGRNEDFVWLDLSSGEGKNKNVGEGEDCWCYLLKMRMGGFRAQVAVLVLRLASDDSRQSISATEGKAVDMPTDSGI